MSLDKPVTTILATQIEAHLVEVRPPSQEELDEVDISRFAIGREWDALEVGKSSERYFSLVKADPDKPSPTVTVTAGNVGAAGVTHPYERRKFTIPEVKRLSGFPDDFQLTGNFSQQWERLGRAVPPVMMFHIAHSLEGVLRETHR